MLQPAMVEARRLALADTVRRHFGEAARRSPAAARAERELEAWISGTDAAALPLDDRAGVAGIVRAAKQASSTDPRAWQAAAAVAAIPGGRDRGR